MFKEMIEKIFRRPAGYLGLAFVVWLCCFQGYFWGGLSFTSDAVSYHDHIWSFLANLMQGHFPLWDPHWSGGVPNDFFLRRICPFNPFYLFVIILHIGGMTHYFAYMTFLAGYLFFGMAGFYLLCRKLTGDEVAAFVSFGVLLFSALSTRIFDSYMIFVVTPLAWFLYFLVRFCSAPGRLNALGLTFFAMILMTTYIPFYFIIIVCSFAIVFAVVYCYRLGGIFRNVSGFIVRERLITLFCAAAVLCATLPGFLFFNEAGKGNISIPGRHYSTAESHALAVQNQAEDSWAVPEEFYFSAYYHDLKRITFAIVYVPCIAFILLVIGAGLRFSRLMVFLATWGGLILLFTSPFASPLYAFLREKIFFFKYFRNLHFLLWFALFPVFALFIGELFRSFREEAEGRPKGWLVPWIITAHAVLFGLACWQPYALITTKITIVLSCGFFVAYLRLPALRGRGSWVIGALLFLLVLQPLEVYHYFPRNVPLGTTGFDPALNSGYQYTMSTVGEWKMEGNRFPVEAEPGKPSGAS